MDPILWCVIMSVVLVAMCPVFYRYGLIGWIPALYRLGLRLLKKSVGLPFASAPSEPGRLAFPCEFFMPYCVCPECNSEALHWMEDLVAEAKWAELYGWYPISDEEHKLIKMRDEGMTVLRTCRECTFQWGQIPGLSEVVAA